MLFAIWAPLLLQLVIPVVLLLWLGRGHPRSGASWLMRVLLVSCYIVAIAVGGMWLVLPWYMPLIYAVALILIIAYSRSTRALPFGPKTRRELAGVVLTGVVAVFAAGLALYLLSGWRQPPHAIGLGFPLRGGTYLVVNGGGNQLINAHLGLKGERFRRWRGQNYGVDLVKLDGAGLRTRGILPRDPARYAIFGEPIYAPCPGTVVRAEDGAEEMPPPQVDREHMAGNHVILECSSVWILLGHMQNGSVRVRQGERVAAGQLVGRVGNTGNTGEPHLHIHAQRPGTAEAPLSGQALPLVFDERYPVRNSQIRVPPARLAEPVSGIERLLPQ
jgi:hypothetical protein